ncbi:MAG TPA: ATP-binding protein [Spirochaetia bacterium]|nr:ATP-binding protein [Spirochaetia bacterium]
MAIDTFAQNPAVQTRVYEEARQKGDQLSSRNVAPKVLPSQVAADTSTTTDASEAAPSPAREADKDRTAPSAQTPPAPRPQAVPGLKKEAAVTVPAPATPLPRPAPQPSPPSQFVRTSQLLSQIASRGEYGIIPRFIGEKLVFLFWERLKDGRIAGCQVADAAFRSRIAGVLESTWTPVRILTLLDENGSPLAAPPGSEGRDWRRPFVAREISESLPRWEAAAYLTRPDSIASQARSSSLVIWVLVMILFVSVAGGGTMVLSSVYAGMRTAQQKATFVTNVSHELKTPLTSISLFVDLLRRKGPLAPAKREQYLSLMASETERLTRLINNVLDFSRDKGSRRYAMRSVDAAEVAAQIVESQRVRLEGKGFQLTLHPAAGESGGDPRGHPTLGVHADPEAVKQVLLNLLSNAEKYSKDRKEIAVEVARDAAAVTLSVSDRGIGVPEKERERIFREFYRVDDSLSSGVQGTGLGLSIARRIARDHGGDITCEARPGGGSRFTVRLPAVTREDGE